MEQIKKPLENYRNMDVFKICVSDLRLLCTKKDLNPNDVLYMVEEQNQWMIFSFLRNQGLKPALTDSPFDLRLFFQRSGQTDEPVEDGFHLGKVRFRHATQPLRQVIHVVHILISEKNPVAGNRQLFANSL